jgi:hypothetical protein
MYRTDAGRRFKARRRHAAIVAGTWAYMQPVEIVAGHIDALVDAGMALKAIAEEAGVSRSAIGYMRGRQRPLVLGEVAQAILSVPLPARRPVAGGNLPALGTQRKLRGLLAIGYPMTRQAQLCGIDDTVLHYIAYAGIKAPGGQRIKHPTVRGVTRATAAAVAAMYQTYSFTPLPRDRFTQRARNLATAHGWAPPEAWTEDTIDDPAAEPYSWRDGYADDPDDVAVAEVVAGRMRWMRLAREVDRLEVVRILLARGLGTEGIAYRMGTSRGVIRRLAKMLAAADTEAAA